MIVDDERSSSRRGMCDAEAAAPPNENAACGEMTRPAISIADRDTLYRYKT